MPTRSYYHWLGLAYAATIPGHPAVTVPCGLDADGLPFGLQLVGRRHGDRDLLAIAAQVEAVLGPTPPPDRTALRAAPPLREAEGFITMA